MIPNLRTLIPGLRRIVNQTLAVDRQIQIHDKEKLPKNRKQRKAFVMREGISWVRKWAASDELKRKYDPSIFPQYFGMSLYCLRHSYAVHLIGQGATLDWISQSMGNTRETCERYYSGHVLSSDSIEMLRRITAPKRKKPSAA